MSRTRLADLKPWWAQIYRDRHLTANNGGFPTGDYYIQRRAEAIIALIDPPEKSE